MTSVMYGKRLQQGAAALIFLLLVLLTAIAVIFSGGSAQDYKNAREKKTSEALAQAKVALIAYATKVDLNHPGCANNCRRPGDLPCPDLNDDGIQEGSCGNAAGTTSQSSRLGRLPWRTLGLGDIRDGDGERLWYAVSSRFKQNTRFLPLNSETQGTVSIRNANGVLAFDASGNSGVVAVVFAVGGPLTRQDGLVQVRDTANVNVPSHYLDLAMGEDNADFVDGTTNGFIAGPVLDANGNVILNDKSLIISQKELSNAIAPRVALEVQNALLDYYCGASSNSDYRTKTCVGAGGSRFYPSPARFNNFLCLGHSDASGLCIPDDTSDGGRLPSSLTPAWSPTSPLIGTSNNNWFQQNGWRELIYYARAPACKQATLNCSGAGFLTLNGVNKQILSIVSGSPLATQPRASNQMAVSNYLELENASPLDNNYVRVMPLSDLINDYTVSIP